jgi:hypothetical protein
VALPSGGERNLILEEITEKLEQIDRNVFYGAVDMSMKETLWNYIVFNRVKLTPSQNRTGYTAEYAVHIVREDFIPEGLEEEVIEALKTIKGLRVDSDGGTYDYVTKPSTNNVVEMFTVNFYIPRKAV